MVWLKRPNKNGEELANSKSEWIESILPVLESRLTNW
jgi:hypothetical protein